MKVGDEVYLREDSELNDGFEYNPICTKGRIIDFDANENLPISVDWGFGSNSYKSSDLILASEYEKENMIEPKGHQNASILMEIAKEAAINEEYWKEYEVKFYDEEMTIEWVVCRNESDLFYGLQNDINIRRKPRTIRIGSYDVKYPEEIRISVANPNYVFINMGSVCNAELMLKALQALLGAKNE